ncbi:signal peptidase II [Mucilaginibacter conchicola]|uniref:Lipoprotein signal peptidase n=1 Tax=Mucilaginibacter conchicola TaxID=2303333 RepID=A0A372NN53_9SPHI|nr:signal peptidase II [Mucilaginibacter conchicola]RFZ90361.1 signal peptidase II [Mucilaginibacter conchicola]
MKLKGAYRIIAILALLALNISCDQVTKMMMREHINIYDQHRFFNGHVTLLHVENMGAFLSLGSKLIQPFRFILLTLVPILALIGGLFFVILKKNIHPLMGMGIVCCVGGGMGNLYDRIRYGSVTDFLHLKFGPLQTGIFNAADVSIMIGLGFILLDGFLTSRRQKRIQARRA